MPKGNVVSNLSKTILLTDIVEIKYFNNDCNKVIMKILESNK